METLNYFDCNCVIGMRKVLNPGSFYKVEDLVERMKYYGIQKALVYHTMAREYNPATGNGLLMDEIKSYPSLYPVWVVMPHHTGEFPEPDALRIQLKKNNVRAVCMFPAATDNNYSIAGWNCGGLFAMLERCSIPVMIEMEQISWNDLYELCSKYPELRVVLTKVNYRIDRNIYALLKEIKHLYIETIGYKVNNGIAEICEKFGAKHLVFGSGMPVFSGSAAVSMINYAHISEKEKQMIAHENIESLLGGVHYE